ncbi:MAG: tautomerase family protein [Bacillota bacterium]
MPQVIIHASDSLDVKAQQVIVSEVRQAIPEVLGIDENIGQVILYKSSFDSRSIHESRDTAFMFIQISMYPGRSRELKERLANRVIDVICKYSNVSTRDIICTISEINPDNYFGGTSHKYIEEIEKGHNK